VVDRKLVVVRAINIFGWRWCSWIVLCSRRRTSRAGGL